ncbi:MAG: type IV pilin [Candidatus Thermoplasmatota archaeon]|nr:type IV pilin [Candidatus Thermoplasmatota archaeon]MBU1940293.1 type IV pilin [Candidatus Thermoplasmatota archaeon]
MRMKLFSESKGVSEIVGTIMLLIMAIALFTTVYVFIMNEALTPPERSPVTSIIGTTEGTNNIILENRGGEDLSSDTIILLNVAGHMFNMTVADFSGWDTNGDGKWNIGEKIVYSSANIYGLQVEAIVVDPYTNSIVMRGVLQEGGIIEYPYIVTLQADSIESNTARLWLQYNFRANYSGNVRFQYRTQTGSWMNTSWSALTNGEGNKNFVITGLIPDKKYWYKAQLKYDTTILEDVQKTFNTLGVIVGWWRFDSGVGTVAFDYSGRNNDGILYNGPGWTTAVNNTGLSFDGIDDYVYVSDHSSLDLSEAVTIEAWVDTLEHSQGQIADIQSIIDTSSFASFSCSYPNFIHVTGDIYAVVFSGDSAHGLINTLHIDNAGNIKPTIIDSFDFYGAECYWPNITQVSAGIFAIAFQGPGNDGYVRTIQIGNDGIVNRTIIDTLEFDTDQGVEPFITHIANDVYAIAYTGTSNDGYLATITIHPDGFIDNSVIDKKAFDHTIEVNAMGESREFDMIHIDGSKYAIIFRNRDSDGEIRTIKISGTGTIDSTVYSDGCYEYKYTFDVFDGWRPDIIHISGEKYGIVYKGFENAGSVRTIKIKNDAKIESIIDWFKFDKTYGNNCYIRKLSGNWYVTAYTSSAGVGIYPGKLQTFQLLPDGTIDETGNDTYTFETTYCSIPNILHVFGDIYAISYTGKDGDGVVKTVRISATGNIDTIIDAQEIGIFDCEHPMLVQAKNNIYAMVFQGFDGDGYIRTFEIKTNGDINNTIIDSWEFDQLWSHEPQILKIADDVFLIISPGDSWHGYARTLRINETGFIFPIDEYEFESIRCVRPSIVHVANDVYAIAYRGQDEDGYVATIEVASDGSITPMVISILEFWGADIYFPEIAHVYGDYYVISFTQVGTNDGYIRTIKIASDGTIGGVVATSEYDAVMGYRGKILHVNGTIFALFYEGNGQDGYIRTVQIQNDGTITSDWHADGSYYIDTLTYDTSRGLYVTPIHIQGRTFAFVYTDQWNNGCLRTVRIGENGAITNSVDDSIIFIGSNGIFPNIIHMNNTKYAIAYRSTVYDGYVKTLDIMYTPVARYIFTKSSSYQLYANDNTVWAYINAKVLSAPLQPGMNYVVLTYDKTLASDQMKLYINTTLKAKLTYITAITQTNNHIYMGGVNSLLDEVRLWRSALTQAQINQNYAELTS